MTNPLPPTDSPAGIADGNHCGCIACSLVAHKSDCAVHNGPALPIGACNCGAHDVAIDDSMHDAIVMLVNASRAYGRNLHDASCWDDERVARIALRDEVCGLIARLKRAEAERDRLWKQHMTLISHDNAERRVLQLESERDRLKEALDKVRGMAMISAGWTRAMLADQVRNVVNETLAPKSAAAALADKEPNND